MLIILIIIMVLPESCENEGWFSGEQLEVFQCV